MAPPVQHAQGNGLAVAGLVLGIVALVFFWIPFLNWILAILAIIFGAVGNSKANKIGGKGKGMAIAGLVMGILGAILGVVFVMFIVGKANDENARIRRRYGEITQPVQRAVASAPAARPDVG
ncbi:MAG: DUF4190 domain-containing protein [Kofleriaceae bacterium]